MTSTATELLNAIAHLYEVFANCRIETLVGCPCCTSDEHSRLLVSKPLLELSAEELQQYASDAMLTWGSAPDFKHFLPRIFELSAFTESLGWPDLEIVFSKLRYGKWHAWPAAEAAAVREYLLAFWSDVLETYPNRHDADSTICAIGQAEADLTPYLERWNGSRSEASLLHFADFLQHDVTHVLKRHRLTSGFWQERPTQEHQVREWLVNPDHIDVWEKRVVGATESTSDERFSAAFDLLEVLRNASQWMH